MAGPQKFLLVVLRINFVFFARRVGMMFNDPLSLKILNWSEIWYHWIHFFSSILLNLKCNRIASLWWLAAVVKILWKNPDDNFIGNSYVFKLAKDCLEITNLPSFKLFSDTFTHILFRTRRVLINPAPSVCPSVCPSVSDKSSHTSRH